MDDSRAGREVRGAPYWARHDAAPAWLCPARAGAARSTGHPRAGSRDGRSLRAAADRHRRHRDAAVVPRGLAVPQERIASPSPKSTTWCSPSPDAFRASSTSTTCRSKCIRSTRASKPARSSFSSPAATQHPSFGEAESQTFASWNQIAEWLRYVDPLAWEALMLRFRVAWGLRGERLVCVCVRCGRRRASLELSAARHAFDENPSSFHEGEV